MPEETAHKRGLPTGPEIRTAIAAIGCNPEALAEYCIDLRNQAYEAAPRPLLVDDEKAENSVLNLKVDSRFEIPSFLSQESATAIWLKLHENSRASGSLHEGGYAIYKDGGLLDYELNLYKALTEKFTTDAKIHLINWSETQQEAGA